MARVQFAKIVRKHFPQFNYTTCYSENGRIKYWAGRGFRLTPQHNPDTDDQKLFNSKQWKAMVEELKANGIASVHLERWPTSLLLYKAV